MADPLLTLDPDLRAKLGMERARADVTELPVLLAEIEAFYGRYVYFAAAEARVPLVLFVPVAYALLEDAAALPAAPYISITSPAPECGKSRCLECLHKLLGDERALFIAGSITPAALFRSHEQPIVLLVDEVGRLFARRDDVAQELAAILDNGYRRGATVPRAVPAGKTFEVKRWPVFGPAVLAGLGELPDSTRSRTIPIVLSRRPPEAAVAPFFEADVEPVAAQIREGLARLAPRLARALRGHRPDLAGLAGLRDRTQEAWWGLLAVAELAGEPWARRAREAALALHGGGADVEPDRGVLLLRALREIFAEAGTDRLSTLEVLRRLVEREQEPWPRWWGEAVEAALDRGRPPRRAGAELAARLKPFGISPRVVKMPDGTTARGYARADLEEAWRVYLSRGEGTVNPCAGGDVTDVTDVTALTSEVTSVASVTSGGEAGSPDAGTSNGRGPSLDRGSPRTAGALSAGDVLALARGLGWPALTRSDGSVVETPGSWEALIRGSDAAALRGLWDHLEGVEAAGAALAAEPTAPAAPGEASARAAVLEAARARGWPRVRIGPLTIAGREDGWRTALRHAPRSRLRRLGAALDGRAAPERCPHCDARSREPGYWGHGMRCPLRRPEGARAAGGR